MDLSRYWQINLLTPAGRLVLQDKPSARRFLERCFPQLLSGADVNGRDFQTSLWKMAQSDSDDALMAQLCLRCWISYQIEAVCVQLARQFGETYSFIAADLWPFTLDDDGKVPPTYRSLSIQILTTYDPGRTTLGTWASRLTKSHSSLNRFLMEQGLYRISSWAILNDTLVSQLSKALPHLTLHELKAAEDLLSAYHQVYRQARLQQKQRRSRRCLEPTEEQLLKIAPNTAPNIVFSRLHNLAAQLRRYRIARRRRTPLTQSLDSSGLDTLEVASSAPNDAEQNQEVFLERYRARFIETLDQALRQTVKQYKDRYQKRKPPQGNVYHRALVLFHCQGLSMGDIARKLGLPNQVKVTRLLQLNQFRAEVCICWLHQLKEKIQTDALQHITADRLVQISAQLEQILTEETQSVIRAAAAEARIPKNRSANSLFSRRLCAVMEDMNDIDDKEIVETKRVSTKKG